MVTIIRTDMRGHLRFVLLVVALAGTSAGFCAESEIYVTTGTDGVEIFSNLPRGSVIRQESSAMAAKGRAIIISRQSVQTSIAVADDQRPSAEAEATGKSYLHDD